MLLHRIFQIAITASSAVLLSSAGPIPWRRIPDEDFLVKRTTTTTTEPLLAKRDSPSLSGFNADPNIAVFGDTYYIYPTTDGDSEWDSKTFYVWSSKDLVTWTRSPSPILTLNGTTSGDVPWSTGNAWAPTIIERSSKFYFYFSGLNPKTGQKAIGVAVSPSSPMGPFTAEPTPLITNTEPEGIETKAPIDPAAFFDPVSGRYLLYWGNGVPLVAELSDDMLSVNFNTQKQLSGLGSSDGNSYGEAPFVVYRQGKYHLTYSIGTTKSEDYRVGYATSTEGPEGPWTDHGVVLRKRPGKGILGTGHNSIIKVPGTGEWYIAYHRFAIGSSGTPSPREVTIDRVRWDADTGLMKEVVPTLEGVAARTVPAAGATGVRAEGSGDGVGDGRELSP